MSPYAKFICDRLKGYPGGRLRLKRTCFMGGHQIMSTHTVQATTFTFLVRFSSKFRHHVATASYCGTQLLRAALAATPPADALRMRTSKQGVRSADAAAPVV